jgi:hemolysin-activating ACP:hemolysin acyltransferase
MGCGLDAVRLWTTTEPYSGFKSETISWRLLPALEHDRLRLFHRDGACVGLVTWAFMTREEFDSGDYCGLDVFARETGDNLVIVDMIAPHGKRDVLWISREMRKIFWNMYPKVEEVFAHRGNRNGSFPNKGVWHESF